MKCENCQKDHIGSYGSGRFCSEKCSRSFSTKEKRKEINKCNICGIDKWLDNNIILETHHKDGNKYNNHRDNLECLCPNCHSQTDNWKTKEGKMKYK